MSFSISQVRTAVRYSIIWLVAVAVCSIPAASQTLFEWPDNYNFDVGKYTLIEFCQARAQRVTDSVNAYQDVFMDTMPEGKHDAKAIPPAVQAVVKRCMHRFPPSTILDDQLKVAQKLYFLAGQDADASAIIERRLAGAFDSDSARGIRLLASVIGDLGLTTPVRYDMLLPLLDRFTESEQNVISLRNIYMHFLSGADRNNRQDLVQKYGKNFLEIMKARIDTEDADNAARIRGAIRGINRIMYKAEFIDSLRDGTTAFARAQEQKISSFTKGGTRGVNILAGKKFPTIRGDFVFPLGEQNEEFPRPEKATLMVFTQGDRRFARDGKMRMNSQIARIKQKFPALDIVLVVATKGYLPPAAPPTPAEEAAAFQEMILQYDKLPVTLVISTRPFERLPDPDRRVFGQPTALELETGRSLNGASRMVLIDKDGALVENVRDSMREDELAEMIRAVMEQGQ